jgi:hypothetical protein
MKHIIRIPGADYNLCSVCGYVATDYLIESLEREIKTKEDNLKLKSSKSIEDTLKTLRKTLKEQVALKSKHEKGEIVYDF